MKEVRKLNMAKTEGFTVVLIGVWSSSMLSVDILDEDGFTVCRDWAYMVAAFIVIVPLV